ncbi:hypothetical protein LAZ67_2003071 [Cordylochernes scorpioides]|uniref:Reverse transcriptase domain-containing protein n=1 Tax=Cordylochernes scorpioides TaxID=51811 RepID=A0ABY6K2Q4_9ARAC|nr:hypothetical protein LAZ67_2003071 [Cordylochernes scorpioides]
MVRRWRSWFLEGRQNVHDDERSGRPVTATDNAAVAAVRNVVEADRRVTIDEIMIRLPPGIEIGRSSIGTIMPDVLNFRKVCARWVPRLLSEFDKLQWMETARAFLKRHLRDEDQLFSRIVTGDESWVHHLTPETKRQSMVWKKPDESAPKRRRSQSLQAKLWLSSFGIGLVVTSYFLLQIWRRSNIMEFHDNCIECRFLRKAFSDISPKSIKDPLKIEKGCPQGSNSGPLFWIILLGSIFDLLDLPNVKLFAYADDLIFTCVDDSRAKLEKTCNNCLGKISTWLINNKLNVSPEKCSALYFALSGLNKGLGIVFNRFLSWIDHIKFIKQTIQKKENNLRKMTSSNWGLSPAVIKRIYLSGFERSIVYAAKVWWQDIHNNDTFVKIIRSIQRPFALAICRGYNTLSTDAALFLSGLIPIDLILNLKINVTSLRRPDNIFDIGLDYNIIDIPSKKLFCNPADFNLITFQKVLPNSSDLTIFTDGSKS